MCFVEWINIFDVPTGFFEKGHSPTVPVFSEHKCMKGRVEHRRDRAESRNGWPGTEALSSLESRFRSRRP